jgi:N-acetylneuraminate lyase
VTRDGGPLRGVIAASVTPLREGGRDLDEEAIGPLADFLAGGEVDGILALGTTGEGIMLSTAERARYLERVLDAAGDRFAVAVHCGAQTTADTVALAAHAAQRGADAVAVIAPPYYPFDEVSLLAHFEHAARAARPLPFYVYEFADRSGYAVPLDVLRGLRDLSPNFVGMKVSDAPFERLEPYLMDDLDLLVGPEALIVKGLDRGAVGAVSGLATAFPELVVELVRTRDRELGGRIAGLRAAIQRLPMPAALKAALQVRGVPVREDVRPPLRTLQPDERREVRHLVEEATM